MAKIPKLGQVVRRMVNGVKLKTLILEISDSNRAGFDWTWFFYINKTANGRFTVSRSQSLDGQLRCLPGSSGLKSGDEVLGAVYSMLDEFSYRLGDCDLDEIAKRIEPVDANLAVDFLAARSEWILPTTEEEHDFYRRIADGPVVMTSVTRPSNATPPGAAASAKKNDRLS